MNYKLNADEFDRLSDDEKKNYSQAGDEYIINETAFNTLVEERDQAKKKQDIEAEHRKNAEKREKEANDRSTQLQKDLESAKGDPDKIKEIETNFQKQIDQMKEDRKAEQEAFKQKVIDGEVTKVAEKIAQNFTVPDYMVDHIKKSLGGRMVGDEVKVHALDADGKESIQTIAEFTESYLDKPELKSIVKAKTGTGGGASGPRGGSPTDKKWSEMSGEEQVTLRKGNPERANLLMKAEGFSTDLSQIS